MYELVVSFLIVIFCQIERFYFKIRVQCVGQRPGNGPGP